MNRREIRKQELEREACRLAAFFGSDDDDQDPSATVRHPAPPAERPTPKSYDTLYNEYVQAFERLQRARKTGIDLDNAQTTFEEKHNALVDWEERTEDLAR